MDQKKFEQLLPEHLDSLFRYALLLVKDHQDALDIVQEALLDGWQHAESLREPKAMRNWFRKIVHNRSTTFLRRRDFNEPLPLDLAAGYRFEPGETEAEDTMASTNPVAEMARLIDDATPPRRRTALNFLATSESVKRMAELQQTTEKTVRSDISKLKKWGASQPRDELVDSQNPVGRMRLPLETALRQWEQAARENDSLEKLFQTTPFDAIAERLAGELNVPIDAAHFAIITHGDLARLSPDTTILSLRFLTKTALLRGRDPAAFKAHWFGTYERVEKLIGGGVYHRVLKVKASPLGHAQAWRILREYQPADRLSEFVTTNLRRVILRRLIRWLVAGGEDPQTVQTLIDG